MGWLNPLFETLSRVGTLGLVWIGIALVLAVAWRRFGVLVWTIAAVAIADLAARGSKAVIDVERPSSRYGLPKTLVPAPHDPAFPSGHAATSFAAATILTAAVPRLAPAWFLLAAAIGFSRIYVGVHYPLDVIGGAALGIAVALVLETTRRRTTARAGG